MRVRVGSLFSGIGGFDLAFERAGFEVAWQSEIDKDASAILAAHWPGVINIGDITAVKHFDNARGTLDVLCGGFPCQDLSTAGRRAGLRGSRSGLFFEFARFAEEIAPRWIVLENVPGLLSSNGGRDMGTVLGTLAELGYVGSYRVLDAQNFGVPQRRRRVFIVGHLGTVGDGRPEVLLEPEGVRGSASARDEAGTAAAGITSGGARDGRGSAGAEYLRDDVTQPVTGGYGRGYRLGPDGGTPMIAVAPTVLARHGIAWASRDGASDPIVPVRSFVKAHRAANAEDAETWREDSVTPTLNTFDTGDTRATTIVVNVGQDPIVVKDTALPLSRDGWAQGVAEESSGVRRLTPLECERLQGFPDGWTSGWSDSVRYRCLGNAVCVNVVEWIARRII